MNATDLEQQPDRGIPPAEYMERDAIRRTMDRSEWQEARSRHEDRFETIVAPHVQRRSRHEKDPVADFLFEYYRFRPSHLKRWHPGTGVLLVDAGSALFPDKDGYRESTRGRVLLPTPDVLGEQAEKLRAGTEWIAELLHVTQERAARFGCFGLHEWAMLYRADHQRHDSVPLRVTDDELAHVVESQGLRCTHFDAFRFFAEKARPLNPSQLSRSDMMKSEQPGCLHVNMDVYRWAFKRVPWIPSDLVLDAFELALQIRTLDMAASPYDLREYGLSPVRIETREGQEEFIRQQQVFSDRARHLRERLIGEYTYLLEQMP